MKRLRSGVEETKAEGDSTDDVYSCVFSEIEVGLTALRLYASLRLYATVLYGLPVCARNAIADRITWTSDGRLLLLRF